MSDMSYCRFELLSKDLKDAMCAETIIRETSTDEELLAALRFIVYCREFLNECAQPIIDLIENDSYGRMRQKAFQEHLKKAKDAIKE